MNKTEQSKTQVSAPGGVLSVKIISILLVGLLVVGTVPTTHSYPSAKADFSNIWLAAKEFWDSLHFFRTQQKELEQGSIDISESIVFVDEAGLEKLKTHPQCRSIYVSEYLPTFNSQAIEKCERLIQQHEQNQLFNAYVQQLCQDPGSSLLDRQQIGEIQLRLRKYALMFPQSEIEVAATDVDGLYGSKTCQVIANYQIISKFDVVDGSASKILYDELAAVIHLSEQELSGLNWQPQTQVVVTAPSKNSSPDSEQPQPSFKLPTNPFKRIAFCMRNTHIKQCDYSDQRLKLVKAEIDSR